MSKQPPVSRRRFLGHTARIALASASLPFASHAFASLPESASLFLPRTRKLAFKHTHTGEEISLVYANENHYVTESLRSLNHFLRDHYTGEIGRMDPRLFDVLYHIKQTLRSTQSFQVISGYRCPRTNSNLRQAREGGVAKHSLHMDGKAIDIRLPGIALEDLRNAALSLQAGGVGYYPAEQFIHIDTGRVRRW